MSIQSSMAVMKAKLAGNKPALIALAQQGNVEAVAELKKMMDKQAYAQGLANETAMGQGDTLPVLEQLAGRLEEPQQSGIAAYAGGGRVRAFAGDAGSYVDPSGLDWKEGESPFARGGRRLVDFLRNMQTQDITQPLGGAKAPAANVAPPATPDPVARMQRQAGVGEAPQAPPATPAPRANVGIAPDMTPRDSGPRGRLAVPAAVEGPPDAKELSTEKLLSAVDAMTPLQKERDALRKKSREQLEAAYEARVKSLTPSTFDRVMEFLGGVSAKGGSSTLAALGAGGQSLYAKDKGRKEQGLALKEMYDKADMVLQEADVADRMGDVDRADKLRKEAAALQKQIAAQKSTEALQKSQAGYYDAQAEFTRDSKPTIEKMKAEAQQTRANKVGSGGSGLGAAMKEKDIVDQARRYALAEQATWAKGPMDTPFNLDAVIAKHEKRIRENAGGKATSPAAPAKYDFGALMQGQ